jgi:hypothetical protein
VGSLDLTTTLEPRGPAAAVVLDEQQVAVIGEGAKRFPVAATINGHTWRTTVPEALAAALAGDPAAKASFDGMAFTHRKEYARWIAEAKREETRDRRVAQALEMLREGRTRS